MHSVIIKQDIALIDTTFQLHMLASSDVLFKVYFMLTVCVPQIARQHGMGCYSCMCTKHAALNPAAES